MKNFLLKSTYILLIAGKIDFAVGGQALIEGVMMRSPNYITIAVRKEDGSIVTKKDEFKSLTQRFKPLNIPLLRGVVNLVEMMLVGMKALNWSASQFVDDDAEKEEMSSKLMRVLEVIASIISITFALGFSLFLFKFIPLWTTELLRDHFTLIQENYFVFNIIDGAIKMTLFISYIYLIGLIPSFRRVFQYHGAEHKSIWTYEKNEELIVENAKKNTRFHPRCGTSFVLIVFVIGILVYSLVPRHEVFFLNFIRRVAFLPLVAGIAYEALKLSAKHIDHWWVKLMIMPGLWFQRLTTKEPDEKQLEIGLASLNNALELEGEVIVP